MLIVAVACLCVVVVLGLARHDPWPFEQWLQTTIRGELHDQAVLLEFLVAPSEPPILLPVLFVAAAVCAYQRRWRDVALVIAGPAAAVGLNTLLVKPAFVAVTGMPYPSGHTASLVSVVAVLVLILPRPWHLLALAAGAVCLACAAVGMNALEYHYVVEIAGGALFGVATVLIVRMLTLASPGAPPRSTVDTPSTIRSSTE